MITLAWVKITCLDKAIFLLRWGIMHCYLYKHFQYYERCLAAFRLMSAMAAVHNAIGWYEITTGNYPF